jgi:hypothetical protein
MRQYARPTESGEPETLRDRHLPGASTRVTPRLELTSPAGAIALHARTRQENLRAAPIGRTRPRREIAGSLAGNLRTSGFSMATSPRRVTPSSELQRLATGSADEQLAGRWASVHDVFSGPFSRCCARSARVLGQARTCHDDRIVARALCTLGATEMFFDGPTARAHLHEAVALTTARGEDYWRREALTLIAQTHLFQDDYGPAQAAFAAACKPSDLPLSEQQAAWIHVFRAHVAFGSGSCAKAAPSGSRNARHRPDGRSSRRGDRHAFPRCGRDTRGQTNEIARAPQRRTRASGPVQSRIPPVAVICPGPRARRPTRRRSCALGDLTLDIDNLGGLYPRVISTPRLPCFASRARERLAATNKPEYASAPTVASPTRPCFTFWVGSS